MSLIETPTLPKDKIKILLLENIAGTAVRALNEAGYYNIEHLKTALDDDALIEKLHGVRILGIRSRTQLSKRVIDAADRLMVAGCFSAGTNQVDLKAAQARGVPVFNAPFSNTRSVAELTIAEIVMLMRRVFPRSSAAHNGGWDKSASGSFEVRGKTLGIVGYGNIGSQLAMLAEAMGLRVIYYDVVDKLRHGNVTPKATLKALLAESDAVSLHVPDTQETRSLIGADEIAAMKPGAYLINNSRGNVVDITSLAGALRSGRLAGAAIDVFPEEPSCNTAPFASPLQGLENVILTPHVGGSTQEAQQRIGEEVARKLVEYSDIGSTVGSVNFPQIQLQPRPAGTRIIQVHKNLPGELQRLNEVFGLHQVNIAAQHLETRGEIGYVVLDAEGEVETAEDLLVEIRALKGTIRARRLNRPS